MSIEDLVKKFNEEYNEFNLELGNSIGKITTKIGRCYLEFCLIGKKLHLKNMHVENEFKKQGISKKMLNAVAKIGKEYGSEQVTGFVVHPYALKGIASVFGKDNLGNPYEQLESKANLHQGAKIYIDLNKYSSQRC